MQYILILTYFLGIPSSVIIWPSKAFNTGLVASADAPSIFPFSSTGHLNGFHVSRWHVRSSWLGLSNNMTFNCSATCAWTFSANIMFSERQCTLFSSTMSGTVSISNASCTVDKYWSFERMSFQLKQHLSNLCVPINPSTGIGKWLQIFFWKRGNLCAIKVLYGWLLCF